MLPVHGAPSGCSPLEEKPKGVEPQWWDIKGLNGRRPGRARAAPRAGRGSASSPRPWVPSPEPRCHLHSSVIFNFLLILGLQQRCKNPSKCFREMVMVLH